MTTVCPRRYFEYLDQTQSAVVLAEGIREAYADLFRVNRNAHTMSSAEVKNKMKTLSEGAYTDRVLTQMAGTFATLSKSADFAATPRAVDEASDVPSPVFNRTEEPRQPEPQRPGPVLGGTTLGIGLTYQINIQLPESRDQAVYDAIFKALREHLQ